MKKFPKRFYTFDKRQNCTYNFFEVLLYVFDFTKIGGRGISELSCDKSDITLFLRQMTCDIPSSDKFREWWRLQQLDFPSFAMSGRRTITLWLFVNINAWNLDWQDPFVLCFSKDRSLLVYKRVLQDNLHKTWIY